MRTKKTILLTEDDDIDAETIMRAFKELKVDNPLARARNGEEALNYLRDSSKEKPCLILLDLKMPKMNGVEFLEVAKNDEELRKIPVVILTTSKEQQDRTNSFNLSVAGYIVKPVGYKEFVDVIRTVDLYWTLSELVEN